MTSLAHSTARELDSTASADRKPKDNASSGWVRNSKLGLVCLGLFFVFWAAMALTGWQEHNSDQVAHQEHEISFGEYLTTGHFWEASTENWESEFLQMGAFIPSPSSSSRRARPSPSSLVATTSTRTLGSTRTIPTHRAR